MCDVGSVCCQTECKRGTSGNKDAVEAVRGNVALREWKGLEGGDNDKVGAWCWRTRNLISTKNEGKKGLFDFCSTKRD